MYLAPLFGFFLTLVLIIIESDNSLESILDLVSSLFHLIGFIWLECVVKLILHSSSLYDCLVLFSLVYLEL